MLGVPVGANSIVGDGAQEGCFAYSRQTPAVHGGEFGLVSGESRTRNA